MWELELVAATRTLGLSKAEIVPEDGVKGEENQFPEKGRCWATGGEEQRAAQSLQSCTRELFMNNVCECVCVCASTCVCGVSLSKASIFIRSQEKNFRFADTLLT